MSDGRGLFIVLEGIDRCGKSRQAEKLIEFFDSKTNIRIQNYPDRTESSTGPQIDDFLKHSKTPYEKASSIHRLFAKNRWALDATVRQSLLQGQTVIAVRYCFSGIAYSRAKGLGWEFSSETEIGLLKPDLVFLLDVDPEELEKREGYGNEVFETIAFQQSVRRQMKALINPKFWKVIDGSVSEEKVHQMLKAFVTVLMDKPRSPLFLLSLKDFNLNGV